MTGSPTQVVWFRYDEEGRLVGEERDEGRKVTEVDEDADGKVDKTVTETRISETVSKKRFAGKSRPTVARSERTLDDAGRVVKEESTMRMRGHTNRTIITFDYDDRGRKMAKRARWRHKSQEDLSARGLRRNDLGIDVDRKL